MSDRDSTTRNLSIIGSTGSIGRQALEVVAADPERFRVVALAADRNVALIAEQSRQFRPELVAVRDQTAADELRRRLAPERIPVYGGTEGLLAAATATRADLVVVAVVGSAGLPLTLAAIAAGKDVALANKETLVAGGELVTRAARERGIRLIPVDSEHSALLQCLAGSRAAEVRRLVLTASGGPFRGYSRDRLATVTPEMALNHPTWAMGPKISVDSATLVNKGLEVIEAHWLFGVEFERIDVVVHPQSLVHSLVEFVDGTHLAQVGPPDMRRPIQYALTYPRRQPAPWPGLDLAKAAAMTFEAVDTKAFPSLRLAYEAGKMGGTATAVLSAADEVAVGLFLERRIGFLDIERVVEEVLLRHIPQPAPTLAGIMAADEWARAEAKKAAAGRR